MALVANIIIRAGLCDPAILYNGSSRLSFNCIMLRLHCDKDEATVSLYQEE